MLSYIFVYLLAAVLMFQGVNLLGEQSVPTVVVPGEVRPASVPASRWGGYLVAFGALLAGAALSSLVCPWLAGALPALRNLGFISMAVYGLWLVFGRKVDYTPQPPSREAHGHGH